jgi:hypothetical protein
MKLEFHHIGLPTKEKQPNDIHLADLDVFITDAGAHPHNVEWVRFGPACKLPPILNKVAHVAYKVPSLDEALKGKTVIAPPCEPMPGLRVAFIIDNGAPVEYLEFKQ